MCSRADDPTAPENADDDMEAEILAFLLSDSFTGRFRFCSCNAQLQPHEWRANVCPVPQ